MTATAQTTSEFPGFPDFQSNVTFVPLQFFTAVLPYRSRGCVRLVGYMLRQFLGWVDEDGNLIREKLIFSYAELIEGVGISRGGITKAILEAIEHHLICHIGGNGNDVGTAYGLCWSDLYTDSAMAFRGFFRREVVLSEDTPGSLANSAPKSARKNIPNAFFDRVLRSERLSVARVVGTLLFKSIRWGPAGERKAPVSISITELSRLTHYSRQRVHQALHEAMSRGYVERVQEGLFDPQAGSQSCAATYRIRWMARPSVPISDVGSGSNNSAGVPFTFLNSYKKVNGSPVQKSEREEYKKLNDISIKTESIKTNTTTATAHVCPNPAPVAAAAEGGYRALLDVGFDERTASEFARKFSAEVIERQLAWLPLRQVKQNRLGLLRRAIEQDWPKPEVPQSTPAQVFVAHFEAAMHGLAEPLFSNSSHGQPEAQALLMQLAPGSPTSELAAEWGRRFGQFVARHRPGKTSFAWCARDCGPEFIRRVEQQQARAKDREAAVSRAAALKLKQARYEQFLVATLHRYRLEKPELWKEFQADQERMIEQFGLSAAGRRAMESEMGQAVGFAEFARERGEPVPRIEEWS